MTVREHIIMNAQIAVLKEIATEYSGRTIENIIQQMESRLRHACDCD